MILLFGLDTALLWAKANPSEKSLFFYSKKDKTIPKLYREMFPSKTFLKFLEEDSLGKEAVFP